MLQKNVENFIGCDSVYEKAAIVLFGAPFDSTTSYRPGARFGSSAIRHESFGIETYSPYQNLDLTDFSIFDSGDLELCFGDSQSALNEIEKRADIIFNDNKIPFMIGGEHLVTLGALKSSLKKYPDLHIIHLDAHLDLRDDYLGAKLSHACVMRRAYELIGDGRLHQFCIRSGDKEEFLFAKEHTDLHKFNLDGLDEVIFKINQKHLPIYLSIDMDCIDPSSFSGTGTPEAGGISFNDLLSGIFKICKGNIIAGDLNELAPQLDLSGSSTALACKLLREILLSMLNK